MLRSGCHQPGTQSIRGGGQVPHTTPSRPAVRSPSPFELPIDPMPRWVPMIASLLSLCELVVASSVGTKDWYHPTGLTIFDLRMSIDRQRIIHRMISIEIPKSCPHQETSLLFPTALLQGGRNGMVYLRSSTSCERMHSGRPQALQLAILVMVSAQPLK